MCIDDGTSRSSSAARGHPSIRPRATKSSSDAGLKGMLYLQSAAARLPVEPTRILHRLVQECVHVARMLA